jgi:hypothetical protein
MNWRQLERKRKRLERKFGREFVKLFRSQIESFQNGLESNLLNTVNSPDRYFERGVEDLYTRMIKDTVGEFEGKFDEIRKADGKSKWEMMIIDYLANIGGQRITEIVAYSKKYILNRLKPILQEGIDSGEGISVIARRIIKDIDEYKIGFSRYRAERIARTEIVSSSNWASYGSVKASGLESRVKKKWLCQIDGRERETHAEMNSKEAIPMEDFFEVRTANGGVDLMEYPGDPRGSAGNVINCRCTIIYERI